MREMLKSWMINLVLFSLMSSIVEKMIPGKTFLPYIRLICGMIMVLTLLQPVLNLSGLEEKIGKTLNRQLYEIECRQMENKLLQIEEEQRKEWEKKYRESILEYEEKQTIEQAGE